jgi:hypothetical protein
MEQYESIYESPMLVEVGNFTALTRGAGLDSLDAFDFFSNSFSLDDSLRLSPGNARFRS